MDGLEVLLGSYQKLAAGRHPYFSLRELENFSHAVYLQYGPEVMIQMYSVLGRRRKRILGDALETAKFEIGREHLKAIIELGDCMIGAVPLSPKERKVA